MARDAMSKAIKSVRPSWSAHAAVPKMVRLYVGSIFIIDGEKLVGMVTERDIISSIAEQSIDGRSLQAKDIMFKQVAPIRQR